MNDNKPTPETDIEEQRILRCYRTPDEQFQAFARLARRLEKERDEALSHAKALYELLNEEGFSTPTEQALAAYIQFKSTLKP